VDHIYFNLEYAATLFKSSTIKEIAGNYLEIIKQVVDNPRIQLKDIRVSHGLIKLESTMPQEALADFEL
jgi:hypothetical protein